jgi:hypothetical protein
MSIRHYDHSHETVAEVKACAGQPVASQEQQYERQTARVAEHLAPAASDKQVGFINNLASERNVASLPAATARTLAAVQRGHYASRREASALIDALQAIPRDQRPPHTTGLGALYDQVPDGRYAVEHGGQPVRFYRVGTGEATGRRWMMIQASDDLHRIGYQQKVEALTEVAKDTQAAMIRYGRELGHCGRCGRTLTDDKHAGPDGLTSLQRGIGPDCAEMLGYFAA